MKSSSPEPRVVQQIDTGAVTSVQLGGDLRTGRWTRLGAGAVLGDATTEQLLDDLAERSQRAARAQGYARGWAEGRSAGEAQAAAEADRVAQLRELAETTRQREHAVAVQALESAAVELRARLAEACAAVEARVVDAALELAEAVVGREVVLATEPAGDAVRRVLSILPHDVRTFTLRLHPADAAELDTAVLEGYATVVVPDAGLARGDAVAETDAMVLDASVDAALARVREVLAP